MIKYAAIVLALLLVSTYTMRISGVHSIPETPSILSDIQTSLENVEADLSAGGSMNQELADDIDHAVQDIHNVYLALFPEEAERLACEAITTFDFEWDKESFNITEGGQPNEPLLDFATKTRCFIQNQIAAHPDQEDITVGDVNIHVGDNSYGGVPGTPQYDYVQLKRTHCLEVGFNIDFTAGFFVNHCGASWYGSRIHFFMDGYDCQSVVDTFDDSNEVMQELIPEMRNQETTWSLPGGFCLSPNAVKNTHPYGAWDYRSYYDTIKMHKLTDTEDISKY